MSGVRLPAYMGFGAVLSAAGLPIYIYAPKYYADSYGVSLATLGAVLFALRLIDVVQDPVLGWVSERVRAGRRFLISGVAGIMALSMIGLFSVVPPMAPLVWFAITVTGLFSAFSFLSINFYAQGISTAGRIDGGHVRLAAWRESGALLGVCVAAVVPTVLIGVVAEPLAAFAFGFAVTVGIATWAMWTEWSAPPEAEPTSIGRILGDAISRRLLLLALVNATPLAVSSTLFLFYVEGRLGAVGWEGPLLLLFFLAAAASSPLWAACARKWGEKPVLLAAMGLAIVSFSGAYCLGEGDVWVFAVICVASGASIGADLTLLPAMFARRMAKIAPNGGQGFGLWSLVSKMTLAIAALVLLPVLEWSGFQVGTNNPETAKATLSLLYAGLPSVLKCVAIFLLVRLPIEDER